MQSFIRISAVGLVLTLGGLTNAQTTAPAEAAPSVIKTRTGVEIRIAQPPTTGGESAITPIIRPGELSKHQGYVARAKQGDIDLVFLGDSITEFFGTRAKDVWDKGFGTMKAVNFGISGDRTEHVLGRVMDGELEGFKAKCIVLLLGINNLSTGRNTNEETLAGMKLVVAEIRKNQPDAKLLMLGIFPSGQPTSQARPRIKAINAELITWADNKGVFFLDIGDKFVNPDNSLKTELFIDGNLHPNAAGYQVWSDAIMPKVKELMGM